jgi:hypothetical protein
MKDKTQTTDFLVCYSAGMGKNRGSWGVVVVCVVALACWGCGKRTQTPTGVSSPPGSAAAAPKIVGALFVGRTHADTRKALDAAYRLQPDTRLMMALQAVAVVLGDPPPKNVTASFDGRFAIRSAEGDIGTLSELPTRRRHRFGRPSFR